MEDINVYYEKLIKVLPLDFSNENNGKVEAQNLLALLHNSLASP
jgi:hypothetical protein